MAEGTVQGPCAGVRVVEIARYVSGPFAGQILADLGAEVIKIEDPGGDVMRHATPAHNGLAGPFEVYNRGKKSFVANMRSPEGLAAVRQLICGADVLLDNFRPGVLEKMGLDYESLRKANPRLIYAKVSGFGESGPYADRPVFDQVIQGVVGQMVELGGDGPPKAINTYVVDKVTAILTSHAILAALLHREHTGEGQKVSTNLLDSYAAFMLPEMLMDRTFLAAEPPKGRRPDFFRTLATADGHVIGLLLLDNHYRSFCTLVGREDLAQDPRFAEAGARSPNMDLLFELVGADVARISTDEFVARAAELDVPFARVNSVEDLLSDPQALHNQTIVEFDDPEFGRIRHANYPAKFERSPANARRRAPKFGEHTEALMAELREGAVQPGE